MNNNNLLKSFNSAEEMLDMVVAKEKPLYNVLTHEYVYCCNDEGSIVVGEIGLDEAIAVAKENMDKGESIDFWADSEQYLGGAIYDSVEYYEENGIEDKGNAQYPLDYCYRTYDRTGWILAEDVVHVNKDTMAW